MSLLPQDNLSNAKPPFSGSSPSPLNNSLPLMNKAIQEKSKLEDCEEDSFAVPDMVAKKTIHDFFDQNDEKEKDKSQGRIGNNTSSKSEGNTSSHGGVAMIPPKRKRGFNTVDKEYRSLKRLLRNRVSAQQARERKKVYLNDLEWRAKELEDHNFSLEEKISTLVNENTMLRKILMNTRPKLEECQNVETKA